MKKPDHAYLERIYNNSTSVDKEHYAEYRSNLLLISGEHYHKRGYQYMRGVRSTRDTEATRKLRIVKNISHKIHRYYVNHIMDYAPGVKIFPNNDNEMQDKKDADLNQSVWSNFKEKYRYKEKFRKYAEDFVGMGEVCVTIKWNPSKGPLVGYEPKVDEDGDVVYELDDEGEILRDEMGQPVAVDDEEKPIFKGEFDYEKHPAYNVFRSPEAKDMREAECLGIRKMVYTDTLRKIYANDPEKLNIIERDSKDEYVIFESDTSTYQKVKDQTLVKEFYFRPCPEYPQGWYAMTTSSGILEEMPLPFGIYPIIWQGFDEVTGSPRGKGILRVVRPYQIELNRASSAQAMHQVTIGDDKVLYQAGTKLAMGGLLPGVRGITYQGQPPQILAGRDGSQYYPYIQGTREECYDNVMLNEVTQQKGQMFDPMAWLFAAASERKQYAKYCEKFEQFLKDFCQVTLELAKQYLPDDELIYMVGRSEILNLDEFRSAEPLRTSIRLEAQSENIESRLGRQVTGQMIMQYLGKQLERRDIGQLIKNLPYGNFDPAFKDLTVDDDNAENEMLAIERGKPPVMNEYENHEYTAARIAARMKEPDFEFLPPQVKMLYQQAMEMHNKKNAEQIAKLKAAQAEFIPVEGGLVKCDLYVPKKDDPTRTERALVPQRALEWLIKMLEQQGFTLDKLQDMNRAQLSQLAEMVMNRQTQAGQPGPQGQAGGMPMQVGPTGGFLQ